MPVAATELAEPVSAGVDALRGAELNGKASGHAAANGACANGKAHHREGLGDVLWEDVPEVGGARVADEASRHAPVSASLDCADRGRRAARRVPLAAHAPMAPRRPSRTRS
jgi:hypothetical protein